MIEHERITKKRAPVYIENRVAGANKKTSMVAADYTESHARVPSLLEATQVYQRAIQSILGKTTGIVNDGVDTFTIDEIAKLPVKERVQVLKQLAEIHKILMPTVKIKEEQLADGSVKRTKWASTGE
jgi:hypothetical protein